MYAHYAFTSTHITRIVRILIELITRLGGYTLDISVRASIHVLNPVFLMAYSNISQIIQMAVTAWDKLLGIFR